MLRIRHSQCLRLGGSSRGCPAIALQATVCKLEGRSIGSIWPLQRGVPELGSLGHTLARRPFPESQIRKLHTQMGRVVGGGVVGRPYVGSRYVVNSKAL